MPVPGELISAAAVSRWRLLIPPAAHPAEHFGGFSAFRFLARQAVTLWDFSVVRLGMAPPLLVLLIARPAVAPQGRSA